MTPREIERHAALKQLVLEFYTNHCKLTPATEAAVSKYLGSDWIIDDSGWREGKLTIDTGSHYIELSIVGVEIAVQPKDYE